MYCADREDLFNHRIETAYVTEVSGRVSRPTHWWMSWLCLASGGMLCEAVVRIAESESVGEPKPSVSLVTRTLINE